MKKIYENKIWKKKFLSQIKIDLPDEETTAVEKSLDINNNFSVKKKDIKFKKL